MQQSVLRRGRAIVRVGGDSYEATKCLYDGRAITFTGRVRHVLVTANDQVERIELGDEVEFTIPIGRTVRIEWLR